jgi:hypothetical protein
MELHGGVFWVLFYGRVVHLLHNGGSIHETDLGGHEIVSVKH